MNKNIPLTKKAEALQLYFYAHHTVFRNLLLPPFLVSGNMGGLQPSQSPAECEFSSQSCGNDGATAMNWFP